MNKHRYEITGEQKRGVIECYAPNTLAAYQCVCSDFLPETEVTVRSLETNAVHNYARELDRDGNLIKIYEDGRSVDNV